MASDNGTQQGITDVGCPPHIPDLYRFAATSEAADSWSLKEQVDFFDRHGFLVLHHVFSAETVAELKLAIDNLTSGRNEEFTRDVRERVHSGAPPDFTRGAKIPHVQYEAGTLVEKPLTPSLSEKVRKLMGFVGYEPSIDSAAHDSYLMSLLKNIIGAQDLLLLQDMAMLKYPGGREKPWHQDKAFFDIPTDARLVGCWIALDQATADNGCMRIWKGELQPHNHFPVRDYQLCDTDIPSIREADGASAIVGIPLPPGGVVLFDGMVPHGTPTNTTATKRRALQFHWVASGTPIVSSQLRSDIFGGIPNGASC